MLKGVTPCLDIFLFRLMARYELRALFRWPHGQKLAVQSGYWPLYRYNPVLAEKGKNPFQLDSKAPAVPLETYAYNETRYRMLLQGNQARAEALMQQAQHDV